MPKNIRIDANTAVITMIGPADCAAAAYFAEVVPACMTQSSSKTAWLTTVRFSEVNTRWILTVASL